MPADVVHRLPASIGQRLLWFMSHYRGQQAELTCPLICRITGPLDIGPLRTALDALFARHESLRTTFTGRGPRLTQLIHPPGPTPVVERDLTGRPDVDVVARAELAEEIRAEVRADTWPARVTLWRLAPERYQLSMVLHHLVADSLSCGVLFRELCALLGPERGTTLPAVTWQYRHFAEWQRDQLDGPEGARHAEYWRRQLRGIELPGLPLGPPPTGLPARRSTAAAQISPEATAAMAALARAHHTTPFAAALAVQALLVNALTGQRDIAVASLFANRSKPETARMVGFLANMVVLRVRLPRSVTFADVLRRCRGTVLGAFAHQSLPYQMLPMDEVHKDARRADDVVFQMLAEPIRQSVQVGPLRLEGVIPEEGGRFDVELDLVPHSDGLRALLFHRTDRLPQGWGERYVAAYAELAESVCRAPERTPPKLSMA